MSKSKPLDTDCTTGLCNSGPSPFANQPPMGLRELPPDDPEDTLPVWQKLDPSLPEDAYSVADALWWSRKLGQRQARGADVGYMLRDAADARAVQNALARAWQWWPADSVPRYWKSGGPSRSAALLHVPLPEPGVHTDIGTALDAAPAPQPVYNLRGVEGEIALRLGQDVTPEQAAALTPDTAAALIDAYAVAMEWVDVRWRDGLQAPALTLLADGQCHGGLALGPWQDFAPLRHRSDADWALQSVQLQVAAQAPRTFTGTHSLGSPTWLLADWLQHVTREHGTVPAGTVVTTGTWTGCPEVAEGNLVRVAFEGLGEVRWQF